MVTAEFLTTEFSRRDIFAFAKGKHKPNSSTHRRAATRSIQPQPPNRDYSGKIGRGSFLKGGLVVTLAALGGAYFLSSGDRPSTETFVDPQLVQLGKEIEAWQLMVGPKVIDLFPEVKQAVDLLTGRVNPRQYIPSVQLPIGLASDNPYAALSIESPANLNDPRKIRARFKAVDYPLSWRDRMSTTVQLSPEMRSSTLRWPVLIKEVSQFIDYYAYSKLYLSLVERAGVSIDFLNPNNLPTSDIERTITLAYTIGLLEEILTKKPSFYREIIDAGSAIRVGGILFANWYTDQLNQNRVIPENTEPIKTGHQLGALLQEKGLIHQSGAGQPFYWTKGKSPEINSEEFLQLIKEFRQHNGQVFSI